MIGLVMAVIGTVAYYVWQPLTNPAADITAEDPASIAKYKQWIQDYGLPFVGGKIKAADLPAAYAKVIDFDVKNSDLKSARSFVHRAMDNNLDEQVLQAVNLPESKKFIGHVKDGRQKVEVLKQIVSLAEKGAPDQQLSALADRFVKIPFSATACPEYAEEIERIFRSSLQSRKEKSPALQRVADEIEKNCLPPTPPKAK
jgi:hypothetical protein